jgi:hypothetical protein
MMAEHRPLTVGGTLQVAFATGTEDGSGLSCGKIATPDAALWVPDGEPLPGTPGGSRKMATSGVGRSSASRRGGVGHSTMLRARAAARVWGNSEHTSCAPGPCPV